MLRSKRLFGLAATCALFIGGLIFATPSATPALADGPTPTPTRASGSGGGGVGGGGHGGG